MKILRLLFFTFSLICILDIEGFGQMSYMLAGRIDRTFGEVGSVTAGNGVIGDVAGLDDGTMFWVSRRDAGFGAIQVIKTLADGTLDVFFGKNGRVFYDPGYEVISWAIKRQSDGKLLIAGSANPTDEFGKFDFLVMRLLPNGALDTTFANAGVLMRDFPSPNVGESTSDRAGGLEILPDGKILVVGSSARFVPPPPNPPAPSASVIVLRLNPNGNPDKSFAPDGAIQFPVGTDRSYAFAGQRTAVSQRQQDGKILAGVVVDYALPGGGMATQGKLLRFFPDGTIDKNFGNGGTVTITPGEASGCNSIDVLPDGKILISFGGGITRLLSTGSQDASFGTNGFLYSGAAKWGKLFVMDDGKFIVAGSKLVDSPQPVISHGVLERFYSNGSRDLRFGRAGESLVRFGDEWSALVIIHPVLNRYLYVAGARNIATPMNPQLALTKFYIGK